MTTTTWSTTVTVPPGPWAQLLADVRRLLTVMAAGGSSVTGPGAANTPVLTAESIAFTVTAPASQPLAVVFTREPGDGSLTTNAPHTDGLVLVALERAARHWGVLLTWTSDAGTISRAVATTLVEVLFGADDRTIDGRDAPQAEELVYQAVPRAFAAAGEIPPGDLVPRAAALLTAVLEQLQAERDGYLVALQVTTSTPALPVPPAAP